MAYDEGLAQRLRESLADTSGVNEKKMFGGIAFLVGGNLCVGVVGDELVARVGPAAFDDAVTRTGARPFDFSGRPMRGWVMVRPEGFEDDRDLGGWVGSSLDFVRTLPPK